MSCTPALGSLAYALIVLPGNAASESFVEDSVTFDPELFTAENACQLHFVEDQGELNASRKETNSGWMWEYEAKFVLRPNSNAANWLRNQPESFDFYLAYQTNATPSFFALGGLGSYPSANFDVGTGKAFVERNEFRLTIRWRHPNTPLNALFLGIEGGDTPPEDGYPDTYPSTGAPGPMGPQGEQGIQGVPGIPGEDLTLRETIRQDMIGLRDSSGYVKGFYLITDALAVDTGGGVFEYSPILVFADSPTTYKNALNTRTDAEGVYTLDGGDGGIDTWVSSKCIPLAGTTTEDLVTGQIEFATVAEVDAEDVYLINSLVDPKSESILVNGLKRVGRSIVLFAKSVLSDTVLSSSFISVREGKITHSSTVIDSDNTTSLGTTSTELDNNGLGYSDTGLSKGIYYKTLLDKDRVLIDTAPARQWIDGMIFRKYRWKAFVVVESGVVITQTVLENTVSSEINLDFQKESGVSRYLLIDTNSVGRFYDTRWHIKADLSSKDGGDSGYAGLCSPLFFDANTFRLYIREANPSAPFTNDFSGVIEFNYYY
jgi:hypothetical protein